MKQTFIKIVDLIDVPALLGISALLAQLKDVLGIIALLLTCSYTIWKWTKEIKESKIKKDDNKTKE